VIALEPEDGAGDEEAADLVAAEVEDAGAPVGVFALADVVVFVEMRAVEEGEAVGVAGEVGGDPIDEWREVGAK
jgi:hypothetical protein